MTTATVEEIQIGPIAVRFLVELNGVVAASAAASA